MIRYSTTTNTTNDLPYMTTATPWVTTPWVDNITLPTGVNYNIKSAREDEIFEELEKLKKKLSKTISLVHNCANCGATLNIEENKPVFHCKYCGSTYIIGAAQIYSNY